MKKLKNITLLTALTLLPALLFSQKITNTNFKQEGNNIIVTYNLKLPSERIADIELYVSTDGGNNYTGPLKFVSGDVGEISKDGEKSITWNVFEEVETLEGNISFKVKAKLQKPVYKKENFAAYNISGTSVIGVTYGQVKTFGWYGRIKTNGILAFADYNADQTSITDYDGDGYYVFTDKVKRSRIALTGGLVYRIKPKIYLYGGGGFGYRALLWSANEYVYPAEEPEQEIWAQNTDYSALGAEIELGAMLRIAPFNLSLGVNTINFMFWEVNAGVGMFF